MVNIDAFIAFDRMTWISFFLTHCNLETRIPVFQERDVPFGGKSLHCGASLLQDWGDQS